MPRLTAVREATVAAVCEALTIWVEMEIDQAAEELESPTWRESILAACQERWIEELLDPASEEIGEWEFLVSCLSDAVLWDEDWRDSESLLDVGPKASRAVKKLMGIDEDYYVADQIKERLGARALRRGITLGSDGHASPGSTSPPTPSGRSQTIADPRFGQ